MIVLRLDSFKKDFKKLPAEIQDRVEKQLELLISNPRHPSLHVKKMNDPRNIWELRVTWSYRLTFQTEKNTYILRRVGTHDILKKP